jgi:nucleoside-diphosphate-sugar epimerase
MPSNDRRQPSGLERSMVTGAYGCIGAWTVRQLVREGVEVLGVDAGGDDHRVREPTHLIHLAALQVPASTRPHVWDQARATDKLLPECSGHDMAAASASSKGPEWPL